MFFHHVKITKESREDGISDHYRGYLLYSIYKKKNTNSE